jgi:hypothetical protein
MNARRSIHCVLGTPLLAATVAMTGCASPGDTGARHNEAYAREALSGVTFFDPEVGGIRVDYCLHFATDCGQPAANAFCVRNGFQYASGFDVDFGVGHTVILGDTGSQCVNPGCGGFRFIDCQ